MFIVEMISAFREGFSKSRSARTPRHVLNREDKSLRENLSDKKLDKLLKDTFPSSDPVAMY